MRKLTFVLVLAMGGIAASGCSSTSACEEIADIAIECTPVLGSLREMIVTSCEAADQDGRADRCLMCLEDSADRCAAPNAECRDVCGSMMGSDG